MEDNLKRLESEVAELKRLRTEDAKANEKVVGIFSTQEQTWVAEKKKLKLQIRALLAQFHVIESKKDDEIARLRSDLDDKDLTIHARDAELEERIDKEKSFQDKLRIAEEEVEDLKKKLEFVTLEHSEEMLRHKTEYAELISLQRTLESEVGRLTQEAETARGRLHVAIERRDSAEAELGMLKVEMERMERDVEKKEKVLSATLRKLKVDAAEKQVLVKEVRELKVNGRQLETEVEQLRVAVKSRRRKGGRVGNLVEGECSHGRSRSKFRLLEYLDDERRNERDCCSSEDEDPVVYRDGIATGETNELITVDIRQLQEWVQSEAERYAASLERRHHDEMEAFAEQMTTKDEKMEVFRWRYLTAELETKRLQSHIEGLDGILSKIREENIRLEASLLDKEKQQKSAKDRLQLHLLNCRRNSNCRSMESHDFTEESSATRRSVERDPGIPRPEKKKMPSVERGRKINSNESSPEVKQMNLDHEQQMSKHVKISTSLDVPRITMKQIIKNERVCEDKTDEEKEVILDRSQTRLQNKLTELLISEQKSHTSKEASWKMDMQAMGVSYKIKRLKQQLVVLDKLAGKDLSQPPDYDGTRRTDEKRHPSKGFQLLMSLLDKQIKRYESLEEKANDLCLRMHGGEQDRRVKDYNCTITKEETERLERFLEETFQIQRYIVATGQRLVDIQSRIASDLIDGDHERFEETDMGRFADVVRSLFKDVQRGLEVRIARIIGNLEGTLARHGILQMSI